MDKKQVLDLIKRNVESGVVTKEEVVANLGGQVMGSDNDSGIGEKIIHSLYLIGSVILIVGVIILLAQNWDEIGFGGRILSTLGICVLTYVIGFMTSKGENKMLSQINFLISVVLAPVSIGVILAEMEYEPELGTMILFSFLLTLIYGATQYFVRNQILVVATAIFATILYGSSIAELVDMNSITTVETVIKLSSIVLGIAYMVIAYGYINSIKESRSIAIPEENAVANLFYAAGSLAILIPFMTYDGIWDFLNFFIIIGIAYLGYVVRSKIVFFVAAMTLVFQLIRITWVYFADSIAWPVLLILIGGLIIGVAYGAIRISKDIVK